MFIMTHIWMKKEKNIVLKIGFLKHLVLWHGIDSGFEEFKENLSGYISDAIL